MIKSALTQTKVKGPQRRQETRQFQANLMMVLASLSAPIQAAYRSPAVLLLKSSDAKTVPSRSSSRRAAWNHTTRTGKLRSLPLYVVPVSRFSKLSVINTRGSS